MSIILSADIGGTKTNIALYESTNENLNELKKDTIKSADWATFDDLNNNFLHGLPKPESICLAIAGPIERKNENTIVNVTNLPWIIDSAKLQRQFDTQHVSIINDFEAIAHSVELLPTKDLVQLQKGELSTHGTRAFIGAGTGLGQAIAVHSGFDYKVISTEGGHCDFAPNNDFEVALYQYFNRNFKHVSYERILSGEGITALYNFFSHICQPDENLQKESQIIHDALDKPNAISERAKLDANSLSARTMDLFFRIYGAQAGNLALTCLPSGGLYIAGGIANKNLSLLTHSAFVESFQAKGRMKKLMEKIPINIIASESAGLIGATYIAKKQIQAHH